MNNPSAPALPATKETAVTANGNDPQLFQVAAGIPAAAALQFADLALDAVAKALNKAMIDDDGMSPEDAFSAAQLLSQARAVYASLGLAP